MKLAHSLCSFSQLCWWTLVAHTALRGLSLPSVSGTYRPSNIFSPWGLSLPGSCLPLVYEVSSKAVLPVFPHHTWPRSLAFYTQDTQYLGSIPRKSTELPLCNIPGYVYGDTGLHPPSWTSQIPSSLLTHREDPCLPLQLGHFLPFKIPFMGVSIVREKGYRGNSWVLKCSTSPSRWWSHRLRSVQMWDSRSCTCSVLDTHYCVWYS